MLLRELSLLYSRSVTCGDGMQFCDGCYGCSVERASWLCVVSSLDVTGRQCEEDVQLGFVMDRTWRFHLADAGESCWPCSGGCLWLTIISWSVSCYCSCSFDGFCHERKTRSRVPVYRCFWQLRFCSRRVWVGCVHLRVVSAIECLICKRECHMSECKY